MRGAGLWHPLSSVQAPVSSTLSVLGPCSQPNLDVNTGKSGVLGHGLAKRQLPLIDWITMQETPPGSTVLPSNGVGRKTVKGVVSPNELHSAFSPFSRTRHVAEANARWGIFSQNPTVSPAPEKQTELSDAQWKKRAKICHIVTVQEFCGWRDGEKRGVWHAGGVWRCRRRVERASTANHPLSVLQHMDGVPKIIYHTHDL